MSNSSEQFKSPPSDVQHIYQLYRLYMGNVENERVEDRMEFLSALQHEPSSPEIQRLNDEVIRDLHVVHSPKSADDFERWWRSLSDHEQRHQFERYSMGRREVRERDTDLAADIIRRRLSR